MAGELFEFVFIPFSTPLASFEIFIQLFLFRCETNVEQENERFSFSCFMHETILKYDQESVFCFSALSFRVGKHVSGGKRKDGKSFDLGKFVVFRTLFFKSLPTRNFPARRRRTASD